MYERVGVQPIHCRGTFVSRSCRDKISHATRMSKAQHQPGLTSPQIDLLRYECAPSNHIPDLLQLQNPEKSNQEEYNASKQGQAEDVGS